MIAIKVNVSSPNITASSDHAIMLITLVGPAREGKYKLPFVCDGNRTLIVDRVLAMMLGRLRMPTSRALSTFGEFCTNMFSNPRRRTFRALTPRYRTRDIEYAFQALSFANETDPKALFPLYGLTGRPAGQIRLHDGRHRGPQT